MAWDRITQSEIDRAAAAWLIRLENPELNDADRRAFRAWLDANPIHGETLEEVRRLWAGLADAAATLEQTLRRRRRRRIGLALAAGILIAAGVPLIRSGADYATPYGEIEVVTLADGSVLTLDGNSAADVEIDDGMRRLALRRGRAFFEVSHDPARPFVVTAGTVEAVALGTAFAVGRQGAAVDVVVAEGRVEVRSGSAAELTAAGQQVRADRAGIGEAELAPLETALAWRRGLLVFEDVTLADVAEALGRATGVQVLMPQASVRERRLSGVFREDRPGAVIDAIEAGLGLSTTRLGVAVLVLDP